MKNLIIVGARGFGRQIYGQLEDIVGYNTEFVAKGFLDDASNALDNFPGFPPILSSVEDYVIQPDDVFIVALGDPKMRLLYADKIKQKGGTFISLISKYAYISKTVRHIGVGCMIDPFAAIATDTYIGDFVIIQSNAVIGHDSLIEDGACIDSQSFLGGFAHIKKGAYLATGAKLMPHVTVGEFANINACSLVVKDVPDAESVMGIPAQPSRTWLRMIFRGTN